MRYFLTALFLGCTQLFASVPLLKYELKEHEEVVHPHPEEYVTVQFLGGLGNLMFEAAAACGIAWDRGVTPSFSGIKKIKKCYQAGVFSRFDQRFPSEKKNVSCIVSEITMKNEGRLIYVPNMRLAGYFQSLHYFEKYEKELKELFQPVREDIQYLQTKYRKILQEAHPVGVQLRYYQDGTDLSTKFIQYGADYLYKATRCFSPDCFFVVSSNNVAFAKRNWPNDRQKVVFLEGEADYLEMYLLSMCEHNIITNSSFGFWGAWLNLNPHKKVIRPLMWVGGETREYMTPKNWIMIDAQYNEAAKIPKVSATVN